MEENHAKIILSISGNLVWRLYAIWKRDEFYLFHQEEQQEILVLLKPFGWDLATTSDFIHYKNMGTAIPRGTDEEQDQFIY